ncbi:MAG: ABC transporter ATP-binding protein [Tissierellia bacterium]|nr:ABC transporter ATP-binding protein [Bacillota bacterium]NLL23452.1 ABC transporter ATP-binding protein [Tissierellia bacterium]
MFRHLSPFLKKNAPRYALGILVLLIVDLLQLTVPQLLKHYTDSLSTAHPGPELIIPTALKIGALAFSLAFLRFLWRYLIVFTGIDFENWIRGNLFSHLLELPRSFYHSTKTGDLMAHATNDINQIRMASSAGIIMGVDALFVTASTVTIMATTINPMLTFLALIPMPLIAIGVRFVGRIIHSKYIRVQGVFSSLSEKVQESFSGIRVIKSFSQEKQDLASFNKINESNYKANMSLATTQSVFFPSIRFVGSLSAILGIVIGTRYVLSGRISLGSFVAFINYLEMLVWPMMAMGMFVNRLQQGAASVDRINEIFDEKSNLRDTEPIDLPADLSIQFQNLTFCYPGEKKPALQKINLHIPQGSSLGIIGRTGSGKTTLVNLFLRLYNIDRGMLLIGGRDINSISIDQSREIFGIVPQDNFLFSTTIENNISLSDREPDVEKILAVSQEASLHNEIMSFPDKYKTYLGERGVNLSGGQRQRTSIARLLYKAPPVLILDDALSAVDTKTEEGILERLESRLNHHTVIVISHRISTLKEMDHIIFMDGGRIVEEGTHDELLALGGGYAEIHNRQLLEERIKRDDYEYA